MPAHFSSFGKHFAFASWHSLIITVNVNDKHHCDGANTLLGLGAGGVAVELGLTSLSPVLSVLINNDGDNFHLYSFVISESFRLSKSSHLLYFICSLHNVQYLFFIPLGIWSLTGSEKAIKFTSPYTNRNHKLKCLQNTGRSRKWRGRDGKP